MDRWLDHRFVRLVIALTGVLTFELVARGISTQMRLHETCVNGYLTTTNGSFWGMMTFEEGVFTHVIALLFTLMVGILIAVGAWVKER